MPLITLLAEEIAEVGRTFDYLGPDPLCDECSLKKICFDLEEGARYRVIGLRPTYHDCEAAEGRVRVVEVERITRTATVDGKGAIEGSTVTFSRPSCSDIGCRFYKDCHPEGIKDGSKVTIVKTGEKINCAAGRNRISAVIR